MSEDPWLTYDQLVAQLRRLCEEQRSGTLYISTDDNHSARFSLQQGEITGCCYSMKRGEGALDLIGRIARSRCRFEEGVSGGVGPIPLSTMEVLARLAGSDLATGGPGGRAGTVHPGRLGRDSTKAPSTPDPARVQAQHGVPGRAPKGAAPSPPNPAATPASFSADITSRPPVDAPAAIETVVHALAGYVGPVALMYCDEWLDAHGPIKEADDVRRMVDAVAREIGDPAKEQAFVRQVLGKL